MFHNALKNFINLTSTVVKEKNVCLCYTKSSAGDKYDGGKLLAQKILYFIKYLGLNQAESS